MWDINFQVKVANLTARSDGGYAHGLSKFSRNSVVPLRLTYVLVHHRNPLIGADWHSLVFVDLAARDVLSSCPPAKASELALSV